MPHSQVFLSYCPEDVAEASRLRDELMAGGFVVWWDKDILPGADRKHEIREAMQDSIVVLLCVSERSMQRARSGIYPEALDAIAAVRERKPGGIFLIPVRFSACRIPPIDIDEVRRLDRLQSVDLFPEEHLDENIQQLFEAIHKAIGNRELEIDRAIAHAAMGPQRSDITPSFEASASSSRPFKIITRLPITGDLLFGRSSELSRLSKAWVHSSTNAISIIAWGGLGKSALVNRWLGIMAQDEWRGAKRVFAWSFYFQGTSGATEASSDTFIDFALDWFGDADPTLGSPWQKGERLAALVRRTKTLLILDGLERLQYPPGVDGGRIKDQAMRALVHALAIENAGLCVITSRYPVADIAAFVQTTAPQMDLRELPESAGRELFRSLGVGGPDGELSIASREFGGHPLAIRLLASFLRDSCEGDIFRRSEVQLLDQDLEDGRHAKSVMASYEAWFGEGPELCVLRMVGLFDRPARAAAVDELRSREPISGLTDAITGLSPVQWKQVIARLRRAQLLLDPEPGEQNMLDAHPLVREYFGERLRKEFPNAWRAGNSHLYEYFRGTTCAFPDTLQEMSPLFSAVVHGCRAGRYQEALDEVFISRIERGQSKYCSRMLGAFSDVLALLTCFFETPWGRLAKELTDEARDYILHMVALHLRGLGRLSEATAVMQETYGRRVGHSRWRDAARHAASLSEILLTRGKTQQALDRANECVRLADRSGNLYLRMTNLTIRADAMHQSGRVLDAIVDFQEASLLQRQRQPRYPSLYSIWGFRHWDLLLGQLESNAAGSTVDARYLATVSEWIHTAIKAAEERGHSLLTFGLCDLALGRVNLLRAQASQTTLAEPTPETRELGAIANLRLDQAIDVLRRVGPAWLPLALSRRARSYYLLKDRELAFESLDEALQVAERGGMKLHEADAHLEFARLCSCSYRHNREAHYLQRAWNHFRTAELMINEMAYGRRMSDLTACLQVLEAAQ